MSEEKLERIVGRIEGTINGMKENIERIEKQNGEILKAVNGQKLVCATTVQRFEDLADSRIKANDLRNEKVEERIDSLEVSGVPNKTRKQINVNSVVTAVNLFLTIVKSWMGFV